MKPVQAKTKAAAKKADDLKGKLQYRIFKVFSVNMALILDESHVSPRHPDPRPLNPKPRSP